MDVGFMREDWGPVRQQVQLNEWVPVPQVGDSNVHGMDASDEQGEFDFEGSNVVDAFEGSDIDEVISALIKHKESMNTTHSVHAHKDWLNRFLKLNPQFQEMFFDAFVKRRDQQKQQGRR